MRVLVTVGVWGLIGGSERYAAAIADALEARGHDVSVLCAEDRAETYPGLPERGGRPPLAVPALGARRPSRAEQNALRDSLRELAPDVVLAASNHPTAALNALCDAAPVARFVQDHVLVCPGSNKTLADGSPCNEPLGLACLRRYWLDAGCLGFHSDRHRGRFLEPLGELRQKQAEIAAHARAAKLLVASRYMESELVRAGFDASSIERVGYFTRAASGPVPMRSTHVLPAATRAYLDREDAPLVFTPARLVHPDKGVDYLITALEKLRVHARCVVAGDGPAADWLREKARLELPDGAIHFAGWLDAAQTEALYGASAVVAFPSVWNEPFGLVGLEAMAHSRPVVAFDVGGVRDWLLDGRTGAIVPRRDTDAFARALDRLLSDPPRARMLGIAGRDRVTSEFSEEVHVQRIEDILGRAAS